MKVHLDSMAWIKGHERRVLRLNVIFFLTDSDPSDILVVKGLRIQDGYIKPPALVSRGSEYPILHLPAAYAAELIKEIKNNSTLKENFPEIFPMLSDEIVIQGLGYEKKYFRRDFPNL